ncbi:hypothetical protein [Streptomyces sp. NPDC029003]|uniref:hypothetical protein n=1 Tax=Streptomyces sp. NPDC029003 TaxID=3155125 RepID=UPI0033CE1328
MRLLLVLRLLLLVVRLLFLLVRFVLVLVRLLLRWRGLRVQLTLERPSGPA